MTPDIDEIRRAWLVLCGPCDYAIGGACNCPPGDPRSVIDRLCDEVDSLRDRLSLAVSAADHPYTGPGDGRTERADRE